MSFSQIMELSGESKLIRSAIVILIAIAFDRIFIGYIIKTLTKITEDKSPEAAPKIRTLFSVTRTMLMIVIYFITALLIVQILFNVNATSVIAATGVVGVIAGLGAQSIVKDSISGFFILIENQYAVGDLVTVDGFTGNVESVTIRTTVVKGFEGDRLIIPNGNMTRVINHTRSDKRALIKVHISYDESADRALAVIKRTVSLARGEMPELTDDIEVLGIEELGPVSVAILLIAHCETGAQYTVRRALLKKIKDAFDENGIKMPFQSCDKINNVPL